MDKWAQRKRPVRLERRFEFQTYEETRDFLDRLGDHTEKVKRFPDISFGRTYVNITLRPESDDADDQLSKADHQFASDIDGLLS